LYLVYTLLASNGSNCRLHLLEHVAAEMRRIFNIDDGVEVLIESHYAMTMTETLNKLDLTLDEAGIGYGHRLVIREKQANSSGSRQPRQDLVLITVELTSVCKLYMSQKFTLFPFIFVVVINGLHC